MPLVRADVKLCEGYGNCVQSAPVIFDMDDDDVVVVLREHLDIADVAQAQDAAMACPVRAITIDSG
jgi:ferredoxin